MKLPTVIEILQEWDSSTLTGLIDHLNKHGILTDEQGTGLSSHMIKRWDEGCTEFIALHGYEGGNILTAGAFVEGNGNVYALFDESRFAYTEVNKYLKQFT